MGVGGREGWGGVRWVWGRVGGGMRCVIRRVGVGGGVGWGGGEVGVA